MKIKRVSFCKVIMLLCLSVTFLLFSCRINPDDDDDDDPETDIRILPDDTESALLSFTAQAPDITALRIIGFSSGTPSYPIYALKITDNPGVDENEPEIQMTGGVHGDEQLSIMMVLTLIEYILDNYATNQEIADLVDNNELHFFPSINPYGLANETRYNANSVDLNRNFGWAWVSQAHHGAGPFDQPESQAIRDDALEHSYALSLHGHTGSVCINTLWDYIGTTEAQGVINPYDYITYSKESFIASYLPSYPFIESLATTYLSKVNTAGDINFWMTEGYDWYVVYGSIQDWLYAVNGTMAFTLEYHLTKNHTELDEELFGEVFGYHRDALIRIFQDAGRGISGIVTGPDGIKVDAKVTLTPPVKREYTGPVAYSPFSYTDPDFGDFHIPIQPGTYNLQIEADGYITKTVTGVVVPALDPRTIVVDVGLVPGKSVKQQSLESPVIDPDSVRPDLREE